MSRIADFVGRAARDGGAPPGHALVDVLYAPGAGGAGGGYGLDAARLYRARASDGVSERLRGLGRRFPLSVALACFLLGVITTATAVAAWWLGRRGVSGLKSCESESDTEANPVEVAA